MARGMAITAGDSIMGQGQGEAGHGVVKSDAHPVRGVVACGAIVAQPSLVGVILSMAADTG